jgi:transposase-like protein
MSISLKKNLLIFNYKKLIMGFFSEIFSATVKTALTPVAVVKDAVKIAVGVEPDSTKQLLQSAVDDVENGFNDLADGEL